MQCMVGLCMQFMLANSCTLCNAIFMPTEKLGDRLVHACQGSSLHARLGAVGLEADEGRPTAARSCPP